ncbi:hypothetical protein LY76DRAFT_598057 [Colletotrichum caudatum]|nr:hypothetical protein LY76DRAFT_598057 [Colletotrichum caudatum]
MQTTPCLWTCRFCSVLARSTLSKAVGHVTLGRSSKEGLGGKGAKLEQVGEVREVVVPHVPVLTGTNELQGRPSRHPCAHVVM